MSISKSFLNAIIFIGYYLYCSTKWGRAKYLMGADGFLLEGGGEVFAINTNRGCKSPV
jgi:hypothetical protein